MSTIPGDIAKKFAVYRSDRIFPNDSGPVCQSIENNQHNILFKGYNWVENKTDWGAYASPSVNSTYFCLGEESLAQKNTMAHEVFGHAFGLMDDEYCYTSNKNNSNCQYDDVDKGAYCESQASDENSHFFNVTSSSNCSKWQSVVKTPCFQGAISENYYRSSDNSMMRDQTDPSAKFSDLQLYIIRTASDDFANRESRLRYLQEPLSCTK
jgi:hypothetical protein